MSRALRWIALGVACLALIGTAAIAWVKLSPRTTPAGQPPLTFLDEVSFGQLRAVFNAAADRTRVLAILSPT
jgi:hypothetical protein